MEAAINFNEPEEKERINRPQPGCSDMMSSSRSMETVVNFKHTDEKERRINRSQPGRSDMRSSSRSMETAVNFKRTGEKERINRAQPGRSDMRSSSRSMETAVYFKGAEERESVINRTPPGHSDMGSSSFSMEADVNFEGPEEEERPPSSVYSRDSGITGSSGISTPSIGNESGRPPPRAGPDDVACDLCQGIKLKAWKSCLTCVRSFCEEHGRDHYKHKMMEQHQLVEVTKDLDVYKQNAELKQMITKMEEENRVLREKINSLKHGSSTPSLPAYICQGKTPIAADVILDPETAHHALVISHNGRYVRLGQKSKVQSGSQKFNRWECVLAKNGFSSGRHYWQVEVNKKFTLGVMKSSAERNGRFTFAPSHGYFCVFHYWLSFSALENPVVRLPVNTVPRVLGVCVDVDERWVTFYNVETKDQIYTFKDMKLAPGEEIFPIFRTVERSMDLQISTVS